MARRTPRTSPQSVACSVAMLLLSASPLAQAGPEMVVDSLTLYRDGSLFDWYAERNIWLHDRFNDSMPGVGPAFSSGGTALYSLVGVPGAAQDSAVTESAGQLRLDPAQGMAAGSVRAVGLALQTPMSGSDAGLGQGQSFGVALKLPVSAMPDDGQAYGMQLASDAYRATIAVGRFGGSLSVSVDSFAANAGHSTVSSAALALPAQAAALILGFMYTAPGSTDVLASWGFLDSGDAFAGGLPSFSPAFPLFGPGADHVLLTLGASQLVAVPEPGAAVLLAAGLAALAWRRCQRR